MAKMIEMLPSFAVIDKRICAQSQNEQNRRTIFYIYDRDKYENMIEQMGIETES